nr:MAG TPA: hypothetical protein [Bacteriophage sp.]
MLNIRQHIIIYIKILANNYFLRNNYGVREK